MGINSLQEALSLSLHLLCGYGEAAQNGYNEVMLLGLGEEIYSWTSINEIFREFGVNRFAIKDQRIRLEFWLPPVYVYSLLPKIMRHLGIKESKTALFFGLALLEFQTHAIKRGYRVVMRNPVEKSALTIQIATKAPVKNINFWPVYNLKKEPSLS